MLSDFHQEEVQFLLQEFSNKTPNIPSMEKTDEDSKHSSNKSDIKLDFQTSSFNYHFFQVFDKKILTKSDFLLAILEIGHFPAVYFKKYPFANKKYFWFQIIEKNKTTKELFQTFFDKNKKLSPLNVRELYVKLVNLNNDIYISEIINDFSDQINSSCLK